MIMIMIVKVMMMIDDNYEADDVDYSNGDMVKVIVVLF